MADTNRRWAVRKERSTSKRSDANDSSPAANTASAVELTRSRSSSSVVVALESWARSLCTGAVSQTSRSAVSAPARATSQTSTTSKLTAQHRSSETLKISASFTLLSAKRRRRPTRGRRQGDTGRRIPDDCHHVRRREPDQVNIARKFDDLVSSAQERRKDPESFEPPLSGQSAAEGQ